MKSKFPFFYLLTMSLAAIVLEGCVFRPANVTTRHFILTSIITNEPPQLTTDRLSLGIGTVKMPGYLLRDSMAVRSGTDEIEYFEGALWAERLDHCFQQALAVNLSKLLASDRIYLTSWRHDQVMACIFVDLQQFDVDATGCGTLVAQWRIEAPENDRTWKTGQIRLVQTGGSPRGHPEAVAATLSDLTGKFSRELAQAIVECAKSRPQ